jgi:hypothetical protein
VACNKSVVHPAPHCSVPGVRKGTPIVLHWRLSCRHMLLSLWLCALHRLRLPSMSAPPAPPVAHRPLVAEATPAASSPHRPPLVYRHPPNPSTPGASRHRPQQTPTLTRHRAPPPLPPINPSLGTAVAPPSPPHTARTAPSSATTSISGAPSPPPPTLYSNTPTRTSLKEEGVARRSHDRVLVIKRQCTSTPRAT